MDSISSNRVYKRIVGSDGAVSVVSVAPVRYCRTAPPASPSDVAAQPLRPISWKGVTASYPMPLSDKLTLDSGLCVYLVPAVELTEVTIGVASELLSLREGKVILLASDAAVEDVILTKSRKRKGGSSSVESSVFWRLDSKDVMPRQRELEESVSRIILPTQYHLDLVWLLRRVLEERVLGDGVAGVVINDTVACLARGGSSDSLRQELSLIARHGSFPIYFVHGMTGALASEDSRLLSPDPGEASPNSQSEPVNECCLEAITYARVVDGRVQQVSESFIF